MTPADSHLLNGGFIDWILLSLFPPHSRVDKHGQNMLEWRRTEGLRLQSFSRSVWIVLDQQPFAEPHFNSAKRSTTTMSICYRSRGSRPHSDTWWEAEEVFYFTLWKAFELIITSPTHVFPIVHDIHTLTQTHTHRPQIRCEWMCLIDQELAALLHNEAWEWKRT